jgi:hypothetical protein
MFPASTLLLVTSILGGRPIEKKEIFKPNLYLVRAKALTFSYEADRQARCIFEIEHVFLGPKSLNGERFEARAMLPTIGFGQSNNWTTPEIKKGEVSIWWITERPKEKNEGPAVKEKTKMPRLVAAENNPKTVRLVLFPPVRPMVHRASDADDEWTKEEYKREEQWYQYIEKCSLGMERAYRASDEQRLDVLKELARHDLPLLQGWCLESLENVLPKKEYVAYLTDLASTTKLHLLMEHRIDCQLCKSSLTWINSEVRLKFFQRWMYGQLTEGKREEEENDIVHMLNGTDYTNFSYTTFLRLMIDGLATDRRSEDFKQHLLNVHGCRPRDLVSADDGFAYLMAQIRKPDPNRRLAAARLLIHLVPLCKTQATTVKVLLDDSAYKSIADSLVEAVDLTALVLDGLSGFDGPKLGRGDKKVFLWVRLLKFAPPPQAVRFIREHVRPALPIDPDRVKHLVRDLDHDEFRRREAVSRQLREMGLEAEPILRKASASTNSVELRRRLDALLTQFKNERTITLRAIPILATMESPEARALLERLASGSPDAEITREAKKVIEAKEKQRSKP